VIIWTATFDVQHLRRAVAARPDGILLKTMPADELAMAIADVARGRWVADKNVEGLVSTADNRPRIPLSPRELEVLAALARGLTNPEIGRELFISKATVKRHVESIIEKLEVSDRTAAVAEGLRRGLVT
jgi:DNA-binding NarL/FixJ family response regulator